MVSIASFIFIILLAPYLINLDQYKSEIEKQVQDKFFIKIKINEKISYKPFFRPHIELFSVDLFDHSRKEETYVGNIYKINLNINIFDIIFKKFHVKDIEIIDGIVELKNNYFDNFFKNTDLVNNFNNVKITNLDLKYYTERNAIEVSDINSSISFENGDIKYFDLTGNLVNLPFKSTYRGSKNKGKNFGKFSVRSNDLKFYLDVNFDDINVLKDEYLGNAKIRYANKLSTIGLNNLALQFNFDLKNEHADLNDILVNSFLYKGNGIAKIDFKPRLAFVGEFNFIDTNFKKLSNNNLRDYLVHNKLFDIHEDFYGIFKLNFKNMVTNHNLFNEANAVIVVEGGDVNLKELNLSSKFEDQLKLNGRFITQNKETIFFFNSQIDILNMKNFYKNTNGPREKIAVLPEVKFSGKIKGEINMRKGRLILNEIVGGNNQKLNKTKLNAIQEELNLLLNKDILNVINPKIYSFLF
jgi:hypothetical protein